MTAAICLFSAVIVTLAITVAAAGLSLWAMYSRPNLKKTDWILRFWHPSKTEWVLVKTLRRYLYGPQKPERTTDE